MHGAAQKGWNQMVRFLVENGAELQAVDATGRTPRNMAMGNYELAITEPRPDPLRETVALLEEFCRQDADCDPTAGATSTADRSQFPPRITVESKRAPRLGAVVRQSERGFSDQK